MIDRRQNRRFRLYIDILECFFKDKELPGPKEIAYRFGCSIWTARRRVKEINMLSESKATRFLKDIQSPRLHR